MKRYLFLCISLICVLFVGTHSAFANGAADSGKPTASDPKKTYDIRWTYGFWGTEMDPEGYFQKKLSEKFNVNLTMEYIPQKTLNQKYTIYVASGDMPEILTSQGNPPWDQWVRDGAFVAIDEYINEFPNLKENMKSHIVDVSVKVDGKIWGVPVNWKVVERGIGYRKDWLDKLGLKVPKTVDEYLAVAKAFTFNDPDGNGKKDTWGLSIQKNFSDPVAQLKATYHFDSDINGNVALYRDTAGRLGLGFMQPGVKDFMATMKKAWDAGVVDPASLTNANTKQGWQAGTLGIYNAQMTSLSEDLAFMHQNNPAADIVYGPPLTAPGYPNPRVIPGKGWFRIQQITNAVKEKDEVRRILGMFDWLLGDGYEFLQAGVEGVHYTKAGAKYTQTPYYITSGWNNFTSLIKRYGTHYYYTVFEHGTDVVDRSLAAINMWTEKVGFNYIFVPSFEEFDAGGDMERISLEGMMKIMIGERPLSDLPAVQAEWMKRGGEQYLALAKKYLNEK